jgi:hypothetical protein
MEPLTPQLMPAAKVKWIAENNLDLICWKWKPGGSFKL